MWHWLDTLDQLRRSARPAALVTVIRVKGSTPRGPGAKMVVLPDGSIYGTIGGGRLEQLIIDEARETINAGEPRINEYPLGVKTGQCCGGWVEVFIEPLNCGPRLYLYGAGHVGQAVCRTLFGTPFTVYLIDPREQWVQSEAVSRDVVRFEGEWQDFNADAVWSDQVYVAVMTHRHDLDQEVIEDVVSRTTAYVGLIGSQTKWKRFKQRMLNKGHTEQQLSRVHCPIGLAIGGKAPQEVAISVAAELIQQLHRRVATDST